MMQTTIGRPVKSPAIAKAVTILDDLARSNELGAISAIARRTGMAKSSVADICSTLSALGLLSRGRDGRYLLGRHIVELARGLVGGRRLIEVFADACDAAPECQDETVTLSILDGSDIVIIAARHGRAALPITARIGLRLPAWATASGRCFLSVLEAEKVAEILAAASTTSAGVAGRLPSSSRLMAELAAQEREGYFVDDESTAAGMTSFGARVKGGTDGGVVAAVAVATRTDTLTPKRSERLGAAARAIAAACETLAASADGA
jgi:IclR family transcriptional regulator, blcABC operon repressor